MVDRDDETWVADLLGLRGKQKQEAAFQDLGNFLLPRVRWYLSNCAAPLCNTSDLDHLTQDIVQDCLERIWQTGLRLYRREARFLNYAKQIAFNEARQKLRQRWRRREEPGSSLERDDEDEEGDDSLFVAANSVWVVAELPAEKQVMLKEALHYVDRILMERCSPREHKAFVHKYVDGLPAQEIAQLMKTTDRAVNLLTYSARQKLRQGLEEGGYTLAAFLVILNG
jgi:RNA polymerase sigma factor (sigma-70 family)